MTVKLHCFSSSTERCKGMEENIEYEQVQIRSTCMFPLCSLTAAVTVQSTVRLNLKFFSAAKSKKNLL